MVLFCALLVHLQIFPVRRNAATIAQALARSCVLRNNLKASFVVHGDLHHWPRTRRLKKSRL